MLEDSIRKWNPWWADITSLERLTGIKRYETKNITSALSLPHIKDIIGVRRAGKTTILYQIIQILPPKVDIKNIVFINFDD